MRKFPAIVAAAGLLVSLSACAANPGFTDCVPSGNASLVSAGGAFGSDPESTFPTPLVATSVEVAELEAGDGAPISPDDAIEVTISVYDGETGIALTTQQGDIVAVPLRSFVGERFPVTEAFTCTSAGARFAVTGTAEQLFGPDALGLPPTTTLVVVSDVIDAYPGRATGADQIVPSRFPAVVHSPIGQPGFSFPGDAPTELRSTALKQGAGDTVVAGDTLAVNLVGIVWGASATFASSWDTLSPAEIVASDLNDDPSGVVPGLAQALIGQKTGSQVLVVVPPSDGYPEGTGPEGVVAGDTLVFVVDILAIR